MIKPAMSLVLSHGELIRCRVFGSLQNCTFSRIVLDLVRGQRGEQQ